MIADEIGIGAILYVHEDWRRVDGTPAERERAKYRPREIRAATRTRWTLENGLSISRETLKGRDGQRFYTAQQVEDRIWERVHCPTLLRLIEQADAATLRRVAEAAGYVGE